MEAALRSQPAALRLAQHPRVSKNAAQLPLTSFYLWRSKFGGMDVSDARRLKALELENSRLKRLVADAMLENEAMKEALRKKW